MKKTAISSLFFMAIITFAPISAFLQKQTDTNSDQTLKLGIDLVVLDAYVLNKRTGRAVGSLSRDDFAIYENGIRQQITHFSQDVLPLSVIILIDTSSSVWNFISQIREGAFQALEHLKPDDEIAIMATAGDTELVQDFTRNKRMAAERIKNLDENLEELIATWVVHDLDHITQITRTLAKQYRDAVGPWEAYLSVLKR